MSKLIDTRELEVGYYYLIRNPIRIPDALVNITDIEYTDRKIYWARSICFDREGGIIDRVDKYWFSGTGNQWAKVDDLEWAITELDSCYQGGNNECH